MKNTEIELIVIDGIVIQEEWKDIKGFENYYQVSNYGRVRSKTRVIPFVQRNQYGTFPTTKTVKGRMLSPKRAGMDYMSVCLYGEDKKENYRYIHRLVAEHFIGEIEGFEINHIDGDKRNNFYLNLEISTRQENQDHAFDTGLNTYFRKSVKVKLNGVDYPSIGRASKASGIPVNVIIDRLEKGVVCTTGNFKYAFTVERL